MLRGAKPHPLPLLCHMAATRFEIMILGTKDIPSQALSHHKASESVQNTSSIMPINMCICLLAWTCILVCSNTSIHTYIYTHLYWSSLKTWHRGDRTSKTPMSLDVALFGHFRAKVQNSHLFAAVGSTPVFVQTRGYFT